MPIFEYQCNTCSHEFEKLVFASDEPDVACPACDSHEVTKKMSAA
ncbi:MAG: zinc ribbon domain-containing protein, partial [Desulfotignum sp.]